MGATGPWSIGPSDVGVEIDSMLVLKSPPKSTANRLDLMAPPRTGAKSLHIRVLPGLMGDLDAWIEAQPGPRLLRVEAARRLLTERLASQSVPADNELGEVRSRLIALAGKIDRFVAYTRQLEEQRDALAARTSRLELVSPSPPEVPPVERWPADPRSDPDSVRRARAQLAAAEEAARRREELRSE
jgi:hypothetical protein